jgi:hypothetical protein
VSARLCDQDLLIPRKFEHATLDTQLSIILEAHQLDPYVLSRTVELWSINVIEWYLGAIIKVYLALPASLKMLCCVLNDLLFVPF